MRWPCAHAAATVALPSGCSKRRADAAQDRERLRCSASPTTRRLRSPTRSSTHGCANTWSRRRERARIEYAASESLCADVTAGAVVDGAGMARARRIERRCRIRTLLRDAWHVRRIPAAEIQRCVDRIDAPLPRAGRAVCRACFRGRLCSRPPGSCPTRTPATTEFCSIPCRLRRRRIFRARMQCCCCRHKRVPPEDLAPGDVQSIQVRARQIEAELTPPRHRTRTPMGRLGKRESVGRAASCVALRGSGSAMTTRERSMLFAACVCHGDARLFRRRSVGCWTGAMM